MFSKVNNYLRRLDIKLTIYYTSLLLIISFILFYFIYYRLERNLLKQIDRILHDETLELIRDTKKSDFNIQRVCENFEEEISHRKYYPIYFRVLTLLGVFILRLMRAEKYHSHLLSKTEVLFIPLQILDIHTPTAFIKKILLSPKAMNLSFRQQQ